GFKGAVITMGAALTVIWLASLWLLKKDLGKAKSKPKFSELLSKSRAINILSAARLFLFGARDVWFVIALAVFVSSQLGWDFWWVGGFLDAWVFGDGFVLSMAPLISCCAHSEVPGSNHVFVWALVLTVIPAAIAL